MQIELAANTSQHRLSQITAAHTSSFQSLSADLEPRVSPVRVATVTDVRWRHNHRRVRRAKARVFHPGISRMFREHSNYKKEWQQRWISLSHWSTQSAAAIGNKRAIFLRSALRKAIFSPLYDQHVLVHKRKTALSAQAAAQACNSIWTSLCCQWQRLQQLYDPRCPEPAVLIWLFKTVIGALCCCCCFFFFFSLQTFLKQLWPLAYYDIPFLNILVKAAVHTESLEL